MGMGVLSGGDTAAGTTIVGGQPDEARRGARQRVPVGLERVLYAAAIDPALKAALLADRKAASRGFELGGSERAVLDSLPAEQLAAMIERLDVSRENLARREFLRNVAGTFVALAAGSALGSCSGQKTEPQAQGGAPFLGPYDKADASAPPEPPQPVPGPPAGIRPDVPPQPPEPTYPIGPPAGIRPDIPKPPPSVDVEPPPPPATRGIRPD